VLEGPWAERANMDVTMVETLPEWRYVEGISLREAFEVARAAERQAALYYDALSDLFDGRAKELFLALAKAEEEHDLTLASSGRQIWSEGESRKFPKPAISG